MLVQANHGARERLAVDGVHVGKAIGADEVPDPRGGPREGRGSIIVIIATDAPLLPGPVPRGWRTDRRSASAARAAPARTAAATSCSRSRPATATCSRWPTTASPRRRSRLRAVPAAGLDALFYAVVEATEEAIANALVAGRTMTGRDGLTAHGIPHDRLAPLAGRDARSD